MILRIELQTEQILFGQVLNAISDLGGDIIAVDMIHTDQHTTIRDITVAVGDQVNLCFPSIFRAALDYQATTINEEMKLAAANVIASVVTPKELIKLYIIPGVFNQEISGNDFRGSL